MFEFLKDSFEAIGQRIRSPFLGSIALVFLAVNWKPLIYLVYSEKALEERFEFFDAKTTIDSLYCTPIFWGIMLAIFVPWLKLIGAFFAKFPKKILDKLQHDEAQLQRIYEIEKSEKEESAVAKLEATREQRKIDAAKRLGEAKSIDNAVEKELIEDREQKQQAESEKKEKEGNVSNDEIASSLGKDAIYLLKGMAQDSSGTVSLTENSLSMELKFGISTVDRFDRRRYIKLNDALKELLSLKLILGKPGNAKITMLGYEVVDVLAKQQTQGGLWP